MTSLTKKRLEAIEDSLLMRLAGAIGEDESDIPRECYEEALAWVEEQQERRSQAARKRRSKMNDAQLLQRIAQRASALYKRINDTDVPSAYIFSELFLAHHYVCKLRLKELAEADNGNFAHDIGGIHRHLDIENMKFTDSFYPRFAAKM